MGPEGSSKDRIPQYLFYLSVGLAICTQAFESLSQALCWLAEEHGQEKKIYVEEGWYTEHF